MKIRKLLTSKEFSNQSLSIENLDSTIFPSISIQDTLDLFFHDEILKEFKCESCKNFGEAIIKRKFSMLPRILILHLKRYQYQIMNENLNKSSNNELKENKYNFRLYKNDSIVKIQKYLTLKFLADNKTKINGSKKEKEFKFESENKN